MKPKKTDIMKWINALRSGKYKQTMGALQNSNGYCCLGVACDLFIPKKLKRYDKDGFLLGGVPSEQLFSPPWLTYIINLFHNVTGQYLTHLNDDIAFTDLGQFTFDEIADLLQAVYIEEVLE